MPTFDATVMLTALLAIVALSSVAALAVALIQRDHSRARLKTVSERRRSLAGEAVNEVAGRERPVWRRARTSTLEAVSDKLKLLQKGSLEELRRSMAIAGWRDPSAPAKFAAATAGLPVLFGIFGLMWSAASMFADIHLPVDSVLPIGLACTGGMMPRFVLKHAMKKRSKAITRAYPDALDLMVICVEAGLSSEAAFNRVTDEMITTAPEIAEEFGLLSAELAFLPDRRRPLENLAERTGLASMRSLATTLLQSDRYGTPVAVGIRVLAQEGREARMAAAERKAAALPAKLTVPMILFFLPVLFGVIAGPTAIQLFGGR